MTELLTAAQMRAIEQAAIETGEVTGLELMEHAGRGVVDAIFEEWPELRATSHRAVVLCGPGNNGGDGFVVARLLKEWGWEVEVFLYGNPETLPPDARVNWERWSQLGEVATLTEQSFRKTHPVHGRAYADLYVDAIFGTGLSRRPEGDLNRFLRHFGGYDGDGYGSRTVAVDAPSSLCLDSGKSLLAQSKLDWAIPHAKLTVTFDSPKIGHYLAQGPKHSGKLRTVSIGLEGGPRPPGGGEAPARGGGRGPPGVPPGGTVRLSKPDLASLSKMPSVHKYTHGHALILSGGPGKGGAARLAARGALRIGAGLVTVGCPPAALPETAARLDAIMCRPIADDVALTETLKDARLNALCLGPGLGVGAVTRSLVAAALGHAPAPVSSRPGPVLGPPAQSEAGRSRDTPGTGEPRAVVLDADALTSFEDDPQALFAMLHARCVLTPHAGEFARLFPDIVEKLAAPAAKGPAYSKVDATREAAARAGCTIFFKGPDTVIADPDGRCSINSAHYDRAAPWLATAGSGDVLAGFITGLLARGFSLHEAASTAAWLHVECALSFGPGLIAEDLPEELPNVFGALLG